MLSTFFRKSATGSSVPPNSPKKYAIAKTSRELLGTPSREDLLRKIKRLFSVTEEVWQAHYLYAIHQFCELVQEVPASEIHHHSNEGGLIDHTLEVLHAGVRISQGYILPPNSEPESLVSAADRWRFGVFIAILAHDIGKVVTDLEVVYREAGTQFQYWHPWYGNLPLGAEYSFRYKQRVKNSRVGKSLHEKAAVSLLPKLLTQKAACWLFEDTELLAQLLSTITHSTFGGQVIAEIVRTADCASVSRNLGATTGVKTEHSALVPLHEKLIVSLRKLINDGELKRNKPGAAIWVTDTDTWFVSKATMEAVRVQLLNEGHKSIPKNVVRLFEVLREHDLLVPNPEGESVWTAEIDDYQRNWTQKLTFLRFKNEVIWPTSNPDRFDGSVTPLDKANKPIPEDAEKLSKGEAVEPDAIQEAMPDKALNNAFDSTVIRQKEAEPDQHSSASNTPSKKLAISPISDRHGTTEKSTFSSEEARDLWKHSRRVQEDILAQNEFIAWLLKAISRRQIRANEPKAPVHILDKHVALVTPAIFILYLKSNAIKKRLYEKRAEGKKVYTLLQKELEALDIHQRGSNGQNIVKMSVTGERKQSELKVYLLNRECFPSLSSFSANRVMSIHL